MADEAAGTGSKDTAPVAAAQALYRAGRYAEACNLLVKADEEGTSATAQLVMLAELEMRLGRLGDAQGRLAVARLQSPQDVDVLIFSALACAEAHLTDKFRTYLKRALASAGDSEIVLYDLAEKYLRKGIPSVASAIYVKITSIYPADSQFDMFSYLHLASYYHLSGRNQKAASIMKRARRPAEYGDFSIITMQEVDYWVAFFEGLAAIDAGDSSAGIAVLRDAAASSPVSVAADANIVGALERAGKTEEADAVYDLVAGRLKRRIASSPEDADAYNNFAVFSAMCARSTHEALKYSKLALALAPLRPEYLDTKAALLMALGRYEEGLKTEQRAIILVSSPRWAQPSLFMQFVWQRLDALEKTGRPVPEAFRRLP
ncbi:MAG: hypothetical protein J7M19_00500 [Planctomycetes bacterium]|nr:hypothetical protein [Planctomycetota bacterium]